MADRALVVAAGLALMLVSVTAGWTQTDPAKLLVGRWAGEVRTETGTYDRTLIVKSVEERSGQLVTAAEYGAKWACTEAEMTPSASEGSNEGLTGTDKRARRSSLQRAAPPLWATAGCVGGHPVGVLCDARRPAPRLVGP